MDTDSRHVLAALQAAFKQVQPEAQRVLCPEDELLDIGIGSIAALEMAGQLERLYQIRLPEEQLAMLRTVADFIELIEQQRREAAQA
jgi:acyl carrier protein